jgi:hypothetical protein
MNMYETKAWQRITPAGRFRADEFQKSRGNWILWIDYDSAIALHKVSLTNAGEERGARIAAGDPAFRRITYGCINVPDRFYDAVVHPAFNRSDGIVYVLPETRSPQFVFNSYDVPRNGVEQPARDLERPRAQLVAALPTAPAWIFEGAPGAPGPFDRRDRATKFLPPPGRRPHAGPDLTKIDA